MLMILLAKPRSWLPTRAWLDEGHDTHLGCFAQHGFGKAKKSAMLPKLKKTLTKAQQGDVLELDELWSFMQCKKNKRSVWLAQCRRTGQIVAYTLGDRSEVTCRVL